jgi:SET domain-containing protein
MVDFKEDDRNTVEDALKSFVFIDQSIYLGNAQGKVPHHEDLKCDCRLEPGDSDKDLTCGSRCINRMIYIECHPDLCPIGQHCLNQRFQRRHFPKIELIKTEKKGFGVRTLEAVETNELMFEYVGEVLTLSAFKRRVRQYDEEKRAHFYFMSLNSDEVIDATQKGGLSRFINHSCNPNCETQKWIVCGVLKIGIFTKKPISYGDELTFDYNFERYGMNAQICYCGEPNCRGFIGTQKKSKSAQNDEEVETSNFLSMDDFDEEEEEELSIHKRRKSFQVQEVRRFFLLVEP